MPIKGLTDIKRSLLYAPTLGKIRKGGEKTDARKPGADLDYFRVTFSANYENRGLEQVFAECYGEQPTSLNVFAYGASTEDAFPTGYEEWNAATLLHRCDGETQSRHYDQKRGRYIDDPVVCQKPGGNGCDTCKRVGRLCVILPEFSERTGLHGVFTFETHSVHDIIAIYSMLVSAEHANRDRWHADDIASYGAFFRVPFVLERGKKKISTPNGQGGRAMREKSLVTLTYAPAYTRFALAVLDRLPELESGDYLQLPERVGATDEPAEAVEEIETIEGVLVEDAESETTETYTPESTPHFADDLTLFNGMVDKLNAKIQARDIVHFLRCIGYDGWHALPANVAVAGVGIKSRVAEMLTNENPDTGEEMFRLLATKATYHKTAKSARFDIEDAMVSLQWFGHRAEFCNAVGWKGKPEEIQDGDVIAFAPTGFAWVLSTNYRLALLPVAQPELL